MQPVRNWQSGQSSSGPISVCPPAMPAAAREEPPSPLPGDVEAQPETLSGFIEGIFDNGAQSYFQEVAQKAAEDPPASRPFTVADLDKFKKTLEAGELRLPPHPATIVRLAPSTDRVRQYQRICALEAQGLLPKLRVAPVDFRPHQMLSGSQEVPK